MILYTTQRFPSPIPPRSTSLTHPRHGLPFSEQPGLTICTDQGEANRPVRFPDAYLHPGSSTHRTIVSYHHERRRQPPNPYVHPSINPGIPALLGPTVVTEHVQLSSSQEIQQDDPCMHKTIRLCAGFPRLSTLRHRLPRSPQPTKRAACVRSAGTFS